MTNIDLLQKFSQLSDIAKKEVLLLVNERIQEEQCPKKHRQGGWMKDKIIYHGDFDEPLDELREYME